MDRFGCVHPGFDENGVCTCCKEHYSSAHDQHKDDMPKTHPALVELVIRNAHQP